MKVLLCAINSKYIHTNLAVYSLRAYARQYLPENTDVQIEIAEYTINQFTEEILRGLYEEKADVYAFSSYIWNVSYVMQVAEDLRKVLPQARIWMGGPEVSYDAVETLNTHPYIDLIIKGEGEESFLQLLMKKDYSGILNLAYRDTSSGDVCETALAQPLNMDRLPFVYREWEADMDRFEHKILYYETSRGCPFSCSYCLSSIEKSVRFRSLSLVYEELQFFLDHRIPQVKFVDRTFNCRKEHAMGIWKYLAEHDNGCTNFHFEVSADLLDDDAIAVFRTMRPGLIQLEIGVQSTYEPTIREIHRTMDLNQLAKRVESVREQGNIHQHLDLIAGLPYEDYETFRQSFADVARMQPDQLQLGFLKVLKGSYMYEHQEEYGLRYRSTAPYEILSTKWISFDEINRLKRIEEMVEVYYNSSQYRLSLGYIMKKFDNPFDCYLALAEEYSRLGLENRKHTRLARYEILREFSKRFLSDTEQDYMDECLMYDLYLRENIKKRPGWAHDPVSSGKSQMWLKQHGLLGKAHVEYFEHALDGHPGKGCLVFRYDKRDPLTYEAATEYIGEDNDTF